MNSGKPTAAKTRRQLAVGIWSILIAAMGVTSGEFSTPILSPLLALGFMAIISTLTVLTQVVVKEEKPRDRNRLQGISSVVVIGIIAFGWSWLLGRFQPDPVRYALISMASVSVITSLILSPMLLLRIASQTPAVGPASTPTSPAQVSFEATSEAREATFPDESAESVATVPFRVSTLEPVSPAQSDRESDDVTQWMTRSQSGHEDRIVGGVRVVFAEGQRDLTVHLAFCPPFPTPPRITCEDTDQKNLQVTVAASFAFGARLLIRRNPSPQTRLTDNSAGSCSCRVSFSATATSLQRSA